MFGPWLHSSALPVFAVLSVLVALLYKAVECWLGEVESIAADAVAFLRRLTAVAPPAAPPQATVADEPRRLFGLSFESRPPPVPA